MEKPSKTKIINFIAKNSGGSYTKGDLKKMSVDDLIKMVAPEYRSQLVKKGGGKVAAAAAAAPAGKVKNQIVPKVPAVSTVYRPSDYSLSKLRTYVKKIGGDYQGVSKKELIGYVPAEDVPKVLLKKKAGSKEEKASSGKPRGRPKAPAELDKYSSQKIRTYLKKIIGMDFTGLSKKEMIEMIPEEDRARLIKGTRGGTTAKPAPREKRPKLPKGEGNKYSQSKINTYAKKIGLDTKGISRKDIIDFIPEEDRGMLMKGTKKPRGGDIERLKNAQIKKMDNAYLGANLPNPNMAATNLQAAIRRKQPQEFYQRMSANYRRGLGRR